MHRPRLTPARPLAHVLARAGGVAVAYVLTVALGLAFRTEPENFAIFWPPNGLLLGLLLVSDRRERPLLVLTATAGSVLVNLFTGDPLAVSLGFAFVNIGEPCLAAWLWSRFRPGPARLDTPRSVVLLFALALAVCALSAVAGAGVVVLGLGAPDYAAAWLAFWLSDAMGVMLVTPVVLTWAGFDWGYMRRVTAARAAETAGLLAALTTLTALIFTTPPAGESQPISYAFPITPLLLWAALRFGSRGTAAAVLVVALIAIWNTGRGCGPFAVPTLPMTHRLLLAQAFLSVLSLSSLVLAAALAERQRAQDALRASEERYRQVTETIQEVFWVTAFDPGRVLYVSPAYERICGRPAAGESDGPFPFRQVLHPDDRERVLAAFGQATRGDLATEFRIVRPDGTVRWLHARAFPLRDKSGRVWRVVGAARDVTERKDAELAKGRLIEELQHALAEIKTLRGLIPICAWCKKIRDDAGFWQTLESYLRQHTAAEFSHGICPACYEQQLRGVATAGDPFAPAPAPATDPEGVG